MIHYAIPLQYILTLVLRFISILSTSLITNIKLIWKHFQKAGINFCNNTIFFIWHSPFNTGAFRGSSLPSAQFTCDSKAAGIQDCVLGSCNVDLKTELFKGPTVCLGNILSCSSNICLWYKQATQAHMDVLFKEKKYRGKKYFSCSIN